MLHDHKIKAMALVHSTTRSKRGHPLTFGAKLRAYRMIQSTPIFCKGGMESLDEGTSDWEPAEMPSTFGHI
jgi:hypothetical protein